MLMSARALLNTTRMPTREQMAQAISGNLCRCTGYTAIYEAIEKASQAVPRVAGAEPLRETGRVLIGAKRP
jgi:carbon-monoxide dehydrogenase small subunit